MPSVQVRDLPDPIYRKLSDRARHEHRNLSQQVTAMLAEALGAASDPRERRRNLMKRLREQPLASNLEAMEPPEKLIREDRER